MSTTVPSLEERKRPGLSETLPYARHPQVCQCCGLTALQAEVLRRWIECDEWDQETPESPVVVLCSICSARLIDPHPRLYKPIEPRAPRAGTMPLCISCKWRSGLTCESPLRRSAGGPGIRVEQAQPSMMHVNRGRGRGGFVQLYTEWPTACDGWDQECPF